MIILVMKEWNHFLVSPQDVDVNALHMMSLEATCNSVAVLNGMICSIGLVVPLNVSSVGNFCFNDKDSCYLLGKNCEAILEMLSYFLLIWEDMYFFTWEAIYATDGT